MKKVCTSLSAVVLTVSLLALAGCASLGENISQEGKVAVERVPSAKVDILRADVYQQEENVAVRGVLQRHNHTTEPLQVHIDATILSGDGRVLTETIGRDVWVPRRSPGKGFQSNEFDLPLPVTPPEGSTLKLVCHAGSREAHANADLN